MKQIFPEKKLRGPNSKFHIHVSASDLYIPTTGLSIPLHKNMWTESGNPSQIHECGNWDWDHAIPFLRIHKWFFRCSVVNPLNAEKPAF